MLCRLYLSLYILKVLFFLWTLLRFHEIKLIFNVKTKTVQKRQWHVSTILFFWILLESWCTTHYCLPPLLSASYWHIQQHFFDGKYLWIMDKTFQGIFFQSVWGRITRSPRGCLLLTAVYWEKKKLNTYIKPLEDVLNTPARRIWEITVFENDDLYLSSWNT